MSPERTCSVRTAWTSEMRQSCWSVNTRSPIRKASEEDHLIDWSDRPDKSKGFPRDRGRGSDWGTGKGVWKRTKAPASDRGATTSGNCQGISMGWRMEWRRVQSLPQPPGESSMVTAGGMGTDTAGSPWRLHGSSCRCRRRGRQGEATSWPGAASCPSSDGSGTTPTEHTDRQGKLLTIIWPKLHRFRGLYSQNTLPLLGVVQNHAVGRTCLHMFSNIINTATCIWYITCDLTYE